MHVCTKYESTAGADASSYMYMYIGAKSGTMIVAKMDTKSSKSIKLMAAVHGAVSILAALQLFSHSCSYQYS